VDARLGGLLSRVLRAEKFEAKRVKSPTSSAMATAAARVMVWDWARVAGRRRCRAAMPLHRGARARDLGAATVAMYFAVEGLPARARAQARWRARAWARTGSTSTSRRRAQTLTGLTVLEPDARQGAAAREGARLGEIGADATSLARDLVNEPPTW